MATYKLFLFGSPRLEQSGQALPLPGRKLPALLAYLAVTAQPQSRDLLATLFWPEFDQSTARANLRRELSGLRHLLDAMLLQVEREQVSLPSGPDLWLDVAAFHTCLHECQQHSHGTQEVCPACLPWLQEGADLYTADFLAGFTLPACPAFDEWQFFQAEGFRQILATVLDRLVQGYLHQNEPETAITQAQRRLSLDPLHEPAQRQLITLYAETGNRAAALRQADLCVQLLQDELGAPPDTETAALIERIRPSSPTFDRKAIQPTMQLESSGHSAVRHHLPIQTTSFIGRTAELAEIKHLLLAEADCRLLTLVGPGGQGKTRLALAAAAQTVHAFPDGVFFVALAPVSAVTDIVPAIAEALRFTFYGSSNPQDQLLDYLSQKKLLLLIDNFEHLLAGADLLSAILRRTPDVTLLATARERLHLQEEWIYEVQGLAFPAGSDEREELSEVGPSLAAYSAVQLFTQRAQQSVATFAPTAAEMTAIGRICQLVGGMPLGVELAAPWIRTLSCGEIVAEIERNLDFLTTSLRNIPERHRSLRAVFEQTWRRLSQAEQTALMGLSVFRGGCTREAAAAVAGTTLSVLSSLVDKALLRRTNLGRYELHELIRQFAEAQLQIDPGAVELIQLQHRCYFAVFLESNTARVQGAGQKEALAAIRADLDNVRLAWQRAVLDQDANAIERAAECLFFYHLYRNGHYEAQTIFQLAGAAVAELSTIGHVDHVSDEQVISDQQRNLLGYLMAAQGYFLARTTDLQAGQSLTEKALALVRQVKSVDLRTEGFVLLMLGQVFWLQGNNTKAVEFLELSLERFSETSDLWGQAWALLIWQNCVKSKRPVESEQALQKVLTICHISKDLNLLGYASHNLARISVVLGRYIEAEQYLAQAFRIGEEMDNRLGLAYALEIRGHLLIAQGKYGQAVQTLQQAIANYDEIKTLGNIISGRRWLGLALHLQGNHAQAEQLFRQLLEASTTRDQKSNMANCLVGLGCLAYDQGELRQAEQYQREALALYQHLELEVRVAAVFGRLGQVMVALGKQRHKEAGQHFQQALALAAKHQVAPIALDVCVGMAQLWVQVGDLDAARQLLILAEEHEASTAETREKARQLSATLLAQAPPETEEAAQFPGRQQNLWTAVQELLTTIL